MIAQTAVLEGAAAETFPDSFASGEAQLDWTTHLMFEVGAVQGESMKDAPDAGGGIGVLRHEGGGLATVSYADTAKAEDSFEISAWVHCPREAEGRDGTLTGLAFYLHTNKGTDPEEGCFHLLVCDYRFGSGNFRLAYIGADIRGQPLELERWPLIEQTAPAATEGWRRLRIDVEAGPIEIYRDDVKLNERAIPAERVIADIVDVDAGYAGVLAGHIGQVGTAEARIDDFIYVARSMSPAEQMTVTENGATGRGAGSALFPLGSLVGFSGRTQHAQQTLGNLLVQEVISEFAQRPIELRVAIFRPGPDHRLGLFILRQAGIFRDCWAQVVGPTSDHMLTGVILGASDTVPQPACSDSAPRL